MTTVAAYTDGEIVHMQSDTAVSDDNGDMYALAPGAKVWRRAGDLVSGTPGILMGVSGSVRQLHLLRHEWEVPPLVEGDTVGYWAHVKVPRTIRAMLKFHKALCNSSPLVGDVVFALQGRVYVLGTDLSVLEIGEKYHAIGSGAAFALGSMCSAVSHDPEVILKCALEAARRHDAGTGEADKVLVLGP